MSTASGQSMAQLQQQLTSHIRNPAIVGGPEGIEPRRLNIYSDLFYRNIESFIAGGFPIIRSIFSELAWHAMVRDFMINHRCHSPYFLEISQEFLLYLQTSRQPHSNDPAFLLELAHYEWVELALDVAEDDLADEEPYVDVHGDLLDGLPKVSPLAWSLAYQFPVHKIGVDFQPDQPGQQPTFLVVYRDRKDHVGFMEINSVSARLLELLQHETAVSGRQVLEQIATEMQHSSPQAVIEGGLQTLQQLHSLDIILGSVKK